MRPAGQLIISICHPFVGHVRFASKAMNAAFVVEGSYFGRQRFEGVEERDGLWMHFSGWSYPLEAYAMALEEAGLAITSLREPVPGLADGRNHMAPWLRMPLFLWLKARPLGSMLPAKAPRLRGSTGFRDRDEPSRAARRERKGAVD